MNINNLLTKNQLSNEEWETYKNQVQKEFDDYFMFVSSLIDNNNTKEKINNTYKNIETFVVDRKSTLIPRYTNGRNDSFCLPYRAVAFIYNQNEIEDDEKLIKTTGGIAYLFQDNNLGTKIHELNHALSTPQLFYEKDNNVYKAGLRLGIYNKQSDTINRISGNLLDEGITDAIAKYYYDKYLVNKDSQAYPSTPYSKINQAITIMLGKDLSNKLLINAYYGTYDDYQKFEQHFNNVMQGENINFQDLSKIDYKYENCIDGFNLSDDELMIIATKYRINQCENEEELYNEFDFIKGFEFSDEMKKQVIDLFDKKQKEIQEGKIERK